MAPPTEGLFNGKLPKPQLAASPITYYIQTTTTDFVESQTPEQQAIVVSDESECPEKVHVAPGEYVLTNVSGAGLAVGRAPSRVTVQAGRIASASIDLMRLPVVWEQEPGQTPPTGPQQSGNITHDPIGCIVAGQFPLIDATLSPPGNIATLRFAVASDNAADAQVDQLPLGPLPAGKEMLIVVASLQVLAPPIFDERLAPLLVRIFVGRFSL